MNKSESKYFNTARLMDEALLRLLEKKDFPYITVQELCRTAGVNRSTFYLHYDGMPDLLEETLDFINEKFLSVFSIDVNGFFNRIQTAPLQELIFINRDFLLPYLNFVKENKSVFKSCFQYPETMRADRTFLKLKEYILEPILERFNVSKEKRDYYISFYVLGITAMVGEWIKNNCREKTEQIAEMIIDCIRPSDR